MVSGNFIQLEKMLKKELPESHIKANLHIELMVRLLKRQYNAICEMITTRNIFGWNDEENCMTTSKAIFDGWVRVSHHLGKIKLLERAETAADVDEVEEDNDEDEQFVDAIENYCRRLIFFGTSWIKCA